LADSPPVNDHAAALFYCWRCLGAQRERGEEDGEFGEGKELHIVVFDEKKPFSAGGLYTNKRYTSYGRKRVAE
jgi:hypothetical protein